MLKNKKRALTLIELIGTMAIILIIAGVIVTGVQKIRRYSQKTICASNLKNLYGLSVIYFTDYNKTLPPFASGLDYHVNNENILKTISKNSTDLAECPSIRERSDVFYTQYENRFICFKNSFDAINQQSRFLGVDLSSTSFPNIDWLYVDQLDAHGYIGNGINIEGKVVTITRDEYNSVGSFPKR